MTDKTKNKPTPVFYGRPADDSFESFVEFMDAFAKKLGVKGTLTTEEKREYWEELQKKKKRK